MNSLKYVKAYQKAFNQIKDDHKGEIIYEKMLEQSKKVTLKYILNNFELLDITKTKISEDLTNWIGSTANVAKVNDTNFKKICLKPSKYGFNYVVYQMVFKLDDGHYFELPYIGYSKDFESRMLSHISEALEACAKNQLTRFIDKAIIKAIEEEFLIIKNKIEEIHEFATINNIKDIYFWNAAWGTRKNLKNFIYNAVIGKHFDITILEYHKLRSSALDREKELTKTKVHFIDGDKKIGTIFPYGLNMVAGGSGGSEVDYDFHLFDYVALTSLGMKHEKIVRILNKVYNDRIPSASLSEAVKKEFGMNSVELRDRFLKPVLESLLKDSENFTLRDIASSVCLDVSTLGVKLSQWFNGYNYYDLKALLKAGILDWEHLDKIEVETQKVLRGQSAETWKAWLIDNKISMDELASKFNISKASLYKKTNVIKLSKVLIGQDIDSLALLKKEIKKQLTISLLQQNVDPRYIMEKFFHISYKSPSQMDQSFRDLFSVERYDLRILIEKYSSNSRSLIITYKL